MSILYQMPVIKTESESDEIENSSSSIVIVRKKSKQVLGQISMNQQEQLQQPPQKKRRVSDGASTKVKPPPAVAVARRNARERNRVKQVNNGFSMLRDHIPKEIAETFEQAGRGSAKKLSKVETLRMAVEYIRSLERMLALDTSNDSETSGFHHNNTNFSNMSSISESSLPATPPPENQQPFFYALKPHSGVMETQITIIGGQQYIRIPGTNTFQLVTHDIFENEENIHPNNEFTTIQIHPPPSPNSTTNTNSNIMGSTMNFVNEINSSTSVINTTTATSETPAGSISPYSGHSSLSPAPSHAADNISNNVITEDGQLSCLAVTNDQKLPYNEHLMIHCSNTETSHYDNIILKQEIMDDEGIFDENSLSNEHMIDAMQWWEQQQNLNQAQSP
ncbi:hypothetical protein PVAND_011913 [Polypedilum vanderplanki]|uniref:BHLH domain-containing protein n=1 Tax=Polypedilum vanderplanki TaxID=319348 RepID=A0A9J6CKV4_POLVA|nr:hypothetical protein PVAND_011913 [Polypedilum vanderplanki]